MLEGLPVSRVGANLMAVLLAAGLATSACQEATVPEIDTSTPAPPSMTLHFCCSSRVHDTLSLVGVPLFEQKRIWLTGLNGAAVTGLKVQWSASDGGAVSDSVTTTDAYGTARVTWTLGPQQGSQRLTVKVGTLTHTFTARATLWPASLDIQVDTLRFTRRNQTKSVTVTVRGSNGDVTPAPLSVDDTPYTEWTRCESVTHGCASPFAIQSNSTPGTRMLHIWARGNAQARDSVFLIVEFIPAQVRYNVSFADSLFSSGEKRSASLALTDSGGAPAIGHEAPIVESSAPGVLAVTDSTITAVGTGTATVRASWRQLEHKVTYSVVANLDLGERHEEAVPAPVGTVGCGLSGIAASSVGIAIPNTTGGCPFSSGFLGYVVGHGFGESPWRIATSGRATVAPNGDVFLAHFGGLLSYDFRGATRWTMAWPTTQTAVRSVALSSAGVLYATHTGALIAMNASDSDIRWTRSLQNGIGVAIVGDSLYSLESGYVSLLGKDGAVKWTAALDQVTDRVAVASDGSLYVVSGSSQIWLSRITNSGVVLWTIPLNSSRGLVLDASDNVYTSSAGGLASYSPSGVLRWSVPGFVGAKVLGADGYLYAVRAGRTLRFDPATGNIVGRSTEILSTEELAIVGGRFIGLAGNRDRVVWYSVPFAAAPGWSHEFGTAGRTRARAP